MSNPSEALFSWKKSSSGLDEDRTSSTHGDDKAFVLFLLFELILQLNAEHMVLVPHLFHVFFFLPIENAKKTFQLWEAKLFPLNGNKRNRKANGKRTLNP